MNLSVTTTEQVIAAAFNLTCLLTQLPEQRQLLKLRLWTHVTNAWTRKGMWCLFVTSNDISNIADSLVQDVTVVPVHFFLNLCPQGHRGHLQVSWNCSYHMHRLKLSHGQSHDLNTFLTSSFLLFALPWWVTVLNGMLQRHNSKTN